MVLTCRRLHWKKTVAFLLGLAVLGSGSAGYYLGFSRWVDRTGGIAPGVQTDNQKPNWDASGLGWIPFQARCKNGVYLLNDSTTAYLFGYSRAEEQRKPDGTVPIRRGC